MLDKRGWKRLEWTVITKRELHWCMVEDCFVGIVHMLEVKEPYKIKNGLVICDAGITWMQCAWQNVPLWATAMFDASGKLIQIYFDVCDEVHLNEEDSWFTDLILDVVFDVSGAVRVLDEDELQEAYAGSKIDHNQKEKAQTCVNRLVSVLKTHPDRVVEWFVQTYEKTQKKL